MEEIVQSIYKVVWNPALIAILVLAGIYFSIRTRFVQVRKLRTMTRLLFGSAVEGGKKSKNGFSSFQAFCVSLSGSVGTGNIVGVATAIAVGGPGAIFWMWLIAFFGASTSFMESTLAQIYKFKHNDGWRGGPFSYIEGALNARWLSMIFAIFTIVGYGTLLSMVQSNSVASAFNNSFSIPPLYTGIAVIILLGLVIIGGMKRIAEVATVITPFMAVSYIIMAIVIVAVNYQAIPAAFSSIIKGAFGIGPAAAGGLGSAIAMGVKRGLFSNEAGQGGGAIVSGSADVPHPAQQGLVQAFSIYADTLFVCTATALMILVTGTNAFNFKENYVNYTQTAIDTVFNGFGSIFVSIALAFFTFSTLIAYYFYAESAIIYLCRSWKIMDTPKEKAIIWTYRVLLFVAVLMGSLTGSDAVWTLGDIGLGLTTWINIIVLLILCPMAIKALKDFEEKEKEPEKKQ
ncbi:MAG: alanine:cation symporter family protein [Bacteroidales bacterium]|nr:alanine:cation symporter family protein [Bacteroidales bacterium]